jgi:serine/threonine protein kinase
LQANPAYLERFLMEEWIAKRINSPHVLKPCSQTRKRHYIYVVTEYIEGQTLAQWMIDNPKPDLPTVRGLIEQIAKGSAGLPPPRNGLSGSEAGQHHDRQHRHGEDH